MPAEGFANGYIATQRYATGGALRRILVDSESSSTIRLGYFPPSSHTVQLLRGRLSVFKTTKKSGPEGIAHPLFEGKRAVMFVCGDEPEDKQVVLPLTEEVGFEAVDAGSLASARLLEPHAMLWIKLAMSFGQGHTFAFGLLRR